MILNIYIDGASRGNPGPAGAGAVILDCKGKVLKNANEFLGETTNNIAEYKALILALSEASLLKAKELNISSDSKLLVNQLNKSYKVKDENIKLLYNKALGLIRNFNRVKVMHIERSRNKGADKLANEAIDKADLRPKIKRNVAVFENKETFPESLF